MNRNLRSAIGNFVRLFLPAHKNSSLNALEAEYFTELKKSGICYLPPLLDPDQIKDIKSHLGSKKLHQNYDPAKKLFVEEELPANTHTATYQESEILSCPHIVEAANNSLVLKLVGEYLGCKPTLADIKIWKSFPGFNDSQDSELYHRDVTEIGFLKVFVYLSDVDTDSGPHVFVKGSHKSSSLLEIRRFDVAEVESNFEKSKITTISGSAGSSFIEDTFGIHRATLPTSKERVLLQFVYSVLPIGSYKYVAKYPPSRIRNIDLYTNRLYIG